MAILLDYGVEIIGDGRRAMLRTHRSAFLQYQVVTATQVADPERIRKDRAAAGAAGNLVLYVVERATPALWTAAQTGDVAFVAVRDRSCSVAGHIWPERKVDQPRVNFKLYALARILLSTSTPIFQGAPTSREQNAHQSSRPSLAPLLGVGQPQVSALLRQLPAGTVEKVAAGWVVSNFDGLWDWHMTTYPGPRGVRIAWRSTLQRQTQMKDLKKVAGDAALAMNRERKAAHLLVSGFEAIPVPLQGSAELLDSREPVMAYSRYITSVLTEMHYTRCAPSEATVQLVQPADPTLYATAAAWNNEARTDPPITAWELAHGPRPDPGQATALREWAKLDAQHR